MSDNKENGHYATVPKGEMRLVVGLGNPGQTYQHTLHNIGFLALDFFLEKQEAKKTSQTKRAIWTSLELNHCSCWFLKPQLYMNLSGQVVAPFAQKKGIEPNNTLVLHDDADLEIHRVQIKKDGGTGGHKGLESIFEHWGTKEFYRLRIGVGRDPAQDLSDYVLGKRKKSVLFPIAEKAADALAKVLELGPEKAANIVNVRC